MEWRNKWYLIPGGTSGIGLQAAKDLCAEGAHVVLVGSRKNRLDSALNLLSDGNMGICCDLQHPENVSMIFETCAERNIVFDGLVYCAGVSPIMAVSENDVRVMENTFAINYFSFVEAVKYFQREGNYRKQASIVVISSITASQSVNRQCVYAGSKAAVEAAVRCMAKELMLKGIRVNALALGAVRTEMFLQLEKTNPNLENRYPLGAIPPEQVSNTILYLLSNMSNHMTGSVLKIDSGHDAWLR